MEWQNISPVGDVFIREVLKLAKKYPTRYRVKRVLKEKDGEKHYIVRVWDGKGKVEVVAVEDGDGEIKFSKVESDDWDVEETLCKAMDGRAERVEILTN